MLGVNRDGTRVWGERSINNAEREKGVEWIGKEYPFVIECKFSGHEVSSLTGCLLEANMLVGLFSLGVTEPSNY